MRKVVIAILGLTLILAFFSLEPASIAKASTLCYDSTCTGKSPTAEGCSADAYTAEQVYVDDWNTGNWIGTIQLRYSPACRATWAKVIGLYYYADGYGNAYPQAQLYYMSGPQGAPSPVEKCTASSTWNSTLGGYACQTNMADDANYTTYAYGLLANSSLEVQTDYTNSF